MNIKKPLKGILLLFSLVFGMRTIALADVPKTDLSLHVNTVVLPSGVTLEWHNAIPISASNLVTDPTAVSPGLYYAVYNFGSGCYSTPTPIKVVSNLCPLTTVDLTMSVDSTNKPTATIVSYHSGSPVTAANKISTTAAQTASAGTYFVSYFDAATDCYTAESIILFVGTICDSAKTDLTSLLDSSILPIGATIQWTDSTGNTVADPLNASPGLYSAVYNFGNGCLSTPTDVRVITNVCPATTANITGYADTTNKPSNTILTYHKGLPASDANKMTLAQALAVDSGTYYVAYFDPAKLCYTNTSAIVVAYSICPATPLEINTVDFKLNSNNCNVALNWSLNNQDNVNYMSIMRKAETDFDFVELNKIAVDRSKTLPAKYAYEFKNLEAKNYLFKIKLVDNNAATKYSKTISTLLSCNKNSINIYPNPVSNLLHVNIVSFQQQTFEVKIVDVLGRTIITDKVEIGIQSIVMKYDLSAYANGLYNVIITSPDQTDVFKVKKLN